MHAYVGRLKAFTVLFSIQFQIVLLFLNTLEYQYHQIFHFHMYYDRNILGTKPNTTKFGI